MFKIDKLEINLGIHLPDGTAWADIPKDLHVLCKALADKLGVAQDAVKATMTAPMAQPADTAPLEIYEPGFIDKVPGCCGYDFRQNHSTIGKGSDGLFHRKGCTTMGAKVPPVILPIPEEIIDCHPGDLPGADAAKCLEAIAQEKFFGSMLAEPAKVVETIAAFKPKPAPVKPPIRERKTLGTGIKPAYDLHTLADGSTVALAVRDQLCEACKRTVDTEKEPLIGGVCNNCTPQELHKQASLIHQRRIAARKAAGDE